MYYTIKQEDVGKSHIEAFGRVWPVSDFIGRIFPGDVGKQVYQVALNVLQVENDEQRLNREKN